MSYLEEQLNLKEGEPHYKAAMYVKEHHDLTLLDFDCWAHLEDLLGFEVSYEDYVKADNTIESNLLDVERGDKDHHAILRALNSEQTQRTTIYTVAIKDLESEEMDIWTSAFSTRELAETFVQEAKRKLAVLGITTVQVCLDSGYLDDDVYLSWLDDRYSEDGEAY